MTWGRHKGKSINWIKNNDSKYLDWVAKNEYVRLNCPKLKSEIEAL